MQFGVCFLPFNNWTAIPQYMELAEEHGFTHGWLTDSQVIWNDVYQYLALCAGRTSSFKLGPMVTNPLTRHPTTVVSAIATLDLISGGRAVLGIGKGDSAVGTIGWRPPTLESFRESIHLIRQLCRGEAATASGTRLQMEWVRHAGRSDSIPLYIASWGPRTLEFAGEVANGVVLQIGSPRVIESGLTHVRAGARKAGRAMDEIDVVAVTPCRITDDVRTARNELRYFPAMMRRHILNFASRTEGFQLPAAMAVHTDVRKKYNYREHGDAQQADTVPDPAVEEYTIFGPQAACVRKIEALQRAGVTQVCVYLIEIDDETIRSTIRTFGKEIIPAFR